jgi:hypothetical protein
MKMYLEDSAVAKELTKTKKKQEGTIIVYILLFVRFTPMLSKSDHIYREGVL